MNRMVVAYGLGLALAAASLAAAEPAAGAMGGQAAGAAQAALQNAGFEKDSFAGWKTFGGGWRLSAFVGEWGADAHSGRIGSVCDVAPGDTGEWRGIAQTMPARAGATYSAGVWVRTFNTEGSSCYLEVKFLDAKGTVLGQAQSEPVSGDQPFARISVNAVTAPKDTEAVMIQGVVHAAKVPATATAYHIFDDFELQEM